MPTSYGSIVINEQGHIFCHLRKSIWSLAARPRRQTFWRAHFLTITAEKKDSQGLCFIGKVKLPVFLQQQLKPKKGKWMQIKPRKHPELAGELGPLKYLSNLTGVSMDRIDGR